MTGAWAWVRRYVLLCFSFKFWECVDRAYVRWKIVESVWGKLKWGWLKERSVRYRELKRSSLSECAIELCSFWGKRCSEGRLGAVSCASWKPMRASWYCRLDSSDGCWMASRIDNLQNYCWGSSRGKSRLLRWLSRWLHSHLHGENDWRLHSSSVFPSEVAAVCLVVFGSLFSSLLWCRLETTGFF